MKVSKRGATSRRRRHWLPRQPVYGGRYSRHSSGSRSTEERIFGNVVLGRTRFGDAMEQGGIEMDGAPDLVRAFPTWLGPTRFAKYALPTAP